MNEHFFANLLSIDEQSSYSMMKRTDNRFSIKDNKVELPDEKLVKQEMVKEITELISNFLIKSNL